jgi:hypothetical protein
MKAVALILVVTLSACPAITGSAAGVEQKMIPAPTKPQFDPDQEKQALEALGTWEPRVKAFMEAFPAATVRVWRAPPHPDRTRIDLSARVAEDYIVNLWFSGVLDSDFRTLREGRCEFFGFVRRDDIAHLKPGQVVHPVKLTLDDLDSLIAAPRDFLGGRATQNGSRNEKVAHP